MRKAREFSDDQRLKAVLKILNFGHSIKEVSNKLDACSKDVGQWLAMYREHGLDGLFCHGRSYTADFKCEVIEYRLKNKLSLSATAVKFCIPTKSTIRKWEQVYNKLGVSGLRNKPRGRPKLAPMKASKRKTKKEENPSEVDPSKALLEELEYLRTENAYLKKLRALVQERISRENGNEQEQSKD